MSSLNDGRVYLGDGLYAYHHGDEIMLAASNGIVDHNTVSLEDSVLWAFFKYVEKVKKVTITVKASEGLKNENS